MYARSPQFYYLEHFQQALAWLQAGSADLLSVEAATFITQFATLEQRSQALLVRMIMRKGPHFRVSKLVYDEIGCPRQAVAPLLARGWVIDDALLSATEVAALLRKDELARCCGAASKATRKELLVDALAALRPGEHGWTTWCAELADPLLSLTISELCERLRLMFFGNLRQDWSAFVLSDLGVFRYERVPFEAASRGFQSAADIDDYLHVQRCRDAFGQGEDPADTLQRLGELRTDNAFIQQRHDRLLFALAQHCERTGALDQAYELYQRSGYPGARVRRIRVLERGERFAEAYALTLQALNEPESEAESQLLPRAQRRLERQLLGRTAPVVRAASAPRLNLCLPRSDLRVELHALAVLQESGAQLYYVENSLIASLFGLLCWEAIFAPLPGAFFHPFQSGPADLYSVDFHTRRAALFQRCLALLDQDRHHEPIRQTWRDKQGIQSPFVHWGLLDEALLEHALRCIPAAHLKAFFQRLLLDLKSNRSGLPDLVQFWPEERRYRLIEVKGPGDRLQDNQRRWLSYCAEVDIPVVVCHVSWADAALSVTT